MASTLDAIKKNFFDSEKVLKAVDANNRRKLSRFGAFVRTRSKSSIRKRKRASKPGEPPSSHTGILKKFIYFSYDEATKSVVVGPAALRNNSTAPRLLEHGGSGVTSKFVNRRGQIHRRGFWRARPFMRPAFEKELPSFLQSLKDSI